jgi:hypothetical protein
VRACPFLNYSKRWVTSIADNSEWRKAASSSSVCKLKSLRLLFPVRKNQDFPHYFVSLFEQQFKLAVRGWVWRGRAGAGTGEEVADSVGQGVEAERFRAVTQ